MGGGHELPAWKHGTSYEPVELVLENKWAAADVLPSVATLSCVAVQTGDRWREQKDGDMQGVNALISSVGGNGRRGLLVPNEAN